MIWWALCSLDFKNLGSLKTKTLLPISTLSLAHTWNPLRETPKTKILCIKGIRNMRLRYPYTLRPFFFSSKLSTMTPQTLFHSSPFPTLKNTPFCQRHRFLPHRPFFTVFCSKPTSRNSSSPLRTNGYIDVSHASIPRPGEVPFSVGDRSALNVFQVANFLCFWIGFLKFNWRTPRQRVWSCSSIFWGRSWRLLGWKLEYVCRGRTITWSVQRYLLLFFKVEQKFF